MRKKEIEGVDNIQCGRIDFYVPLQFNRKYEFSKICRKINKGIDKGVTKQESIIQKELKDIQQDIDDKMTIEEYGKLPLKQKVNRKFRNMRKSNYPKISREYMDNKILISDTGEGIKIELLCEEIETYYGKFEKMKKMYEKYKEIYGMKFANSQDVFVLFPLQIQLNNEEYVWLNASIFVFQNKMGILKLEMNLSNVSSQPLMGYDYDEYIKNIKNPWLVNLEVNQNTIQGVTQAYLNLIESYGVNTKQIGDRFHNIILSDFQGMPKQINNIPNKIIVDLYRIIAAPVSMMECASYEKEAQEYVKEHQWGKFNVRYICSTTGGCLSITDKEFVNYFLELNDFIEEGSHEQLEKKTIYEEIINNLCLNVEYAIIIMILKYMTKNNFYTLQLKNPHEMHKLKREYNFNVMFIAELQENCYGTVSEQVECLEKIMPYYLKDKIANEKLEALDSVLANEEIARQASLQNLLSFGGLMITAMFGFPAIYETLTLVRTLSTFIKNDIPLITVENLSFSIWLTILTFLIISVWVKWRRSKKITL